MSELHQQAAGLHVVLRERAATLATAESLTGGSLAAALTGVPGASKTYVGGVVSYATAVKVAVLGVPQEVVDRHGVISEQCAAAMALGVRRLTGATYALSTTGVAGPDLQEGQRVGTVFVGIAGSRGVRVVLLALDGDRGSIVEQTCGLALGALRLRLGADVPPEETGLG